MRVALHSVIVPGGEAEYERRHRRIPEALAASFTRVGIHDWTIWRSGRDLFHLVDCDDFGAAMRALEDDPANIAWQRTIGPVVDHFVQDGPDAEQMIVPQVWRLSDQRDESRVPDEIRS